MSSTLKNWLKDSRTMPALGVFGFVIWIAITFAVTKIWDDRTGMAVFLSPIILLMAFGIIMIMYESVVSAASAWKDAKAGKMPKQRKHPEEL